MTELKPKETERKWRYSFWTGIMYGPVPVGGIILAVLFVAYVVVYVVYRLFLK